MQVTWWIPSSRTASTLAIVSVRPVKVGIVVPFSWSFWGAVVEHAELQAAALEELGHEVRLIMGNDPPGQFTCVLHPRVGRNGNPTTNVIPVGRSVIVTATLQLTTRVLATQAHVL